MQELLKEFQETITIGYERLSLVSEADSASKPTPSKWSKKEIIGHLIDSASNNHQRFVRVQLYDGLDLPGYEQERWVAVQDYQNAGWANLLVLWKSFNEHLVR